MLEAVVSLILGAVLTLGSPGPAPISLALVSSNFGVRKGLNYLYGIVLGLGCVAVVIGFGLFEVLERYPQFASVLSVFAVSYMVFIAWKIAFADLSTDGGAQPPSFKDGFILNITNPKAYAAFFSLYSTFLLPMSNGTHTLFWTGLIGIAVGAAVDLIWVLLGASLSGFIKGSSHAFKVRKVCGALLLLVVFYSVLRGLL